MCVQRITEVHNNVVITDRMWARLLSSTHQPSFLGDKEIKEAAKTIQEAQSELLASQNDIDLISSSSTANSTS